MYIFGIGTTLFSPTLIQGNQGKGKAWIPVPEEFQRNVQGITLHGGGRRGGQVRGVTDHGSITQLVASGLGQLGPDVDPVTVVFVNALTTDFEFHGLDQDVTNPVQPPEGVTASGGNVRELDAQVGAMNQITIAANGASNFLGPVAHAIEGLFNGLQGEVSMTTVNAVTPLLS